METHISALGHTLNQNDKVEWITSGMILIGEILSFEDDKAKIKPIGFRCFSEEEGDKIRKKIKQSYKAKTNRLFLLKKVV